VLLTFVFAGSVCPNMVAGGLHLSDRRVGNHCNRSKHERNIGVVCSANSRASPRAATFATHGVSNDVWYLWTYLSKFCICVCMFGIGLSKRSLAGLVFGGMLSHICYLCLCLRGPVVQKLCLGACV